MGRRKRRILYRLAEEKKVAQKNATLGQENSVAQEKLKEVVLPQVEELSPPVVTTTVVVEEEKPEPVLEVPKIPTKKITTVAKKTTIKPTRTRTSRKRTPKRNSSK